MSTDRPIGIGLLGVTHPHTSGRLQVLLGRTDVRVLGAADEHPVVEPFVKHFGIRRRTTDDILTDPDVGAVLIHAKSEQMHTLGAAALRAGKAVLVEKPAGRTLADLEFLAAAAAETGGVCQVGYNFRFSRAVAFTERVLAERVLGDPIQVRVHGACSLGEAATTHLNQPGDMGGGLWVIGSHVVDLILHHFGMPFSVNARVPKFEGLFDPSFREDAAAAALQYPRLLVSLDFTSWDPLPWIEAWEVSIYGTQGVLHAGPLPARWKLFLKKPGLGLPAGWTQWRDTSFPVGWAARTTDYSPELAEIANRELFERELDAFLAAVRGKAPVPITAEHARDIARLIAACYESSRQDGRQVDLGQNAQ
jgi:predicted dehydrogenase